MLLFAMAGTAFAQKGKPPKDDGDGGGGNNTANSAIAYIGGGALKVMDADGANQTLVFSPSRKDTLRLPSWYPDGQRILFYSEMNGPGFYRINLDGSGLAQVVALNSTLGGQSRAEVSPVLGVHGQHRIAFRDRDVLGNRSIFVISEDGTGLTQLTFGEGGATDFNPTWSPDGQHLAYVHNADGNFDTPEVDGLRLLTLGEDEQGNVLLLDDVRLLDTGSGPMSFSKTEYKIYVTWNLDLWALRLDDLANPLQVVQLTDTPNTSERWVTGSGDDSQIAYEIEGTIYVANSDGSNPVAMPKGKREMQFCPAFKH
jgi:hypothetical protein